MAVSDMEEDYCLSTPKSNPKVKKTWQAETSTIGQTQSLDRPWEAEVREMRANIRLAEDGAGGGDMRGQGKRNWYA